MPIFTYNKTFKSRKNISLFSQVSYGIRNHDFNGNMSFNRMYNAFNRGFYSFSGGRDFQFIYAGDAWINMLKRSNVYLNNSIGVGDMDLNCSTDYFFIPILISPSADQ